MEGETERKGWWIKRGESAERGGGGSKLMLFSSVLLLPTLFLAATARLIY